MAPGLPTNDPLLTVHRGFGDRMPELVDVEGFRRVFAEHATGRRVVDVDVRDSGVLPGTTAGTLRSSLVGRRFAQPWRHGKWLIAPTDGPVVAMHFGMTDTPVADGSVHRHDRVVFALETVRSYTRPSADNRAKALDLLPTDR